MEQAIHPTQADFVQSVADNHREIIDWRVEGGYLLVELSIKRPISKAKRDKGPKQDGMTHTEGTQRLHQSVHFTYAGSQFLGENTYGAWQYLVRFEITDA